MTTKRFNPEEDLEPMPFDESIRLRALEMKKSGLVWRPHVGCFVWDPDEYIKPTSPFPDRVYFILSLARFVEIFGSIDQIAEKLVWLPTRHQVRLVCQQLNLADEFIESNRRGGHSTTPVEELILIYRLIIEAIKHGST